VTDFRLTQAAVEEWSVGTPVVQATQVAVECWAPLATVTVQMVATQCGIEMWASVAQASRGAPRQALIM
jgi:hypothetical protein